MTAYAFSYASSEQDRWKRWFIRFVELSTGQPKLESLYRENRRRPRAHESFWQACVRSLELDVVFDATALASIPKTGPVVIVANHPFGVLDGIVACWLIEKIRPDYVVLAHSALLRAPEARPYVLPIDFSGGEEALATNLATRAAARRQLDQGGVVIAFPAGMISTSPDRWGRRPAVDARWQPFVAQLIQRSRASVVPVRFAGQNGRLFQIASHINATLRLSLIFRDVRVRIGASLAVAVGSPLPFESLSSIKDRQALMDRLYAVTHDLALARHPSAAPQSTRELTAPQASSLVHAASPLKS